MADALMVTKKGSDGKWAVYLENDHSREPGQLVGGPGPLLRSVLSWQELKDLADEHGIQSHQIYGDELTEMTE